MSNDLNNSALLQAADATAKKIKAFKTPKGNWRCRTCDRIRQATKKAKGLKE